MAKIAPYVFQQFFDNNGNVLAGGKVFTYEAGTTTNKSTFVDADGIALNTNPIILDSNGRANIWLGDGAYKFVLKTAADVTIQTVDDIAGETTSIFGEDFYTITTATLINSSYQNSVVRCTAGVTLSLLPVSSAGNGFYFTVRNDSGANVTIDPDGGELINGATTLVLGDGATFLIYTNGSTWYTLYGPTLYLTSNNSWTGVNTFSGTTTFTGRVTTPDDGELTIAGGVITTTGAFHTVDTQSDAASDDLDTITAGISGQYLYIRANNAARTVVVKHNTGNIFTPGGVDISLDDTDRILALMYDADIAKWVVLDMSKEYIDGKFNTLVNGTKVYQSSGTSVTNATWTTVLFDTEDYDDADWHSTSVNTERITFDFTGRAFVAASYNSGITSNAQFGLRIRLNGTTVARNFYVLSSSTENQQIDVSTDLAVTSGQYVDIQVYQSSGGSATTGTGLAGTTLLARRIK